MKKLFYILPLVALLFASCENYYMEKQLGYETTIEDVRMFKYTLTEADYGTIASNPVNQQRALALEPVDSTYLDWLNNLKSNKYFGDTVITPGLYIPPFLENKYPQLSNGTVCEVTYNVKGEEPAYYAPFATLRQYKAYQVSTVDSIAIVMKEKVHKLNQVEGYMFLVAYREDTTLLYQYTNDAFVPYTDESINILCLTNADYAQIGANKVSEAQLNTLLKLKFPFATAETKYLVLGYNDKGLLAHTEVQYDGANWNAISLIQPEVLSFKVENNAWVENPLYFEEPFLGHGQGDFVIQDVFLQEPLTYIWYYSATYGMCASAYKSGASYDCESWLVSPAISLKKATNPALIFDQAFNKAANFTEECTVLVSTDYKDDVITATWEALEWNTAEDGSLNVPPGTSWIFQTSGDLLLTKYAGQTIHVGFRYTTSNGISGTWELQNILVHEAENAK